MKDKKHTAATKQLISDGVKQAFKDRGLLKPVYKFSKSGVMIEAYESITNAALSVNGSPSNIKYTCEGKFKTAYGFRWSYDIGKCDMSSLKRKGHYHSDELKRKISKKLSGTVVVKNKQGNNFRVDIHDPRYESGELIPANTGIKHPVKQCEWCGKIVSTTNYVRWHSDNCKQRDKII